MTNNPMLNTSHNVLKHKRLPQRVAMITVHTSPLAALGGDKTGGMNVYIRDLSRALACMGIAVDIFTRASDAQAPVSHALGAGVRVIHIEAGPRQVIPLSDVSRHLGAFADGMAQFASDEGIGYDLIHSHYWLSGLVAEHLRRRWRGVPFVQMFHTLGHMKNLVAQHEAERASPERLAGECRVVARADRLVAPTPAERTQLIDYYGADPAKIIVLSPGVDLRRFRNMTKEQAKASLDLSPEHSSIVFTGRIEPLKGIDTLLHATAILRRARPTVANQAKVTIIGGDLRTVGRDQEMTRLHELRCRLNLCDMVRFVGAKDQDVLPYYFAAADMVVMPSHYESFGMVALEAMATGTPVIASAVGGLAELVRHGENGLTFPARDPQALAARMDELLADGELRRRLGSQAGIHARQYDWASIAQRMMDEVYAPLMRNRQGSLAIR